MQNIVVLTSCFFLNDAMFWRCFRKTIDVDVFDDVLQNAKHCAYDASYDRAGGVGGQLVLGTRGYVNVFFAPNEGEHCHLVKPDPLCHCGPN